MVEIGIVYITDISGQIWNHQFVPPFNSKD